VVLVLVTSIVSVLVHNKTERKFGERMIGSYRAEYKQLQESVLIIFVFNFRHGLHVCYCGRLYQVASQHYDCSLLLRALRGWYRVIRIARAQRREREEEEDRKRKMRSLLQVARETAGNNLRWD